MIYIELNVHLLFIIILIPHTLHWDHVSTAIYYALMGGYRVLILRAIGLALGFTILVYRHHTGVHFQL